MALGVNKLSYALGAEITGLDLRDPLDDRTVDEIRRIWMENLVVVIRGQDVHAGPAGRVRAWSGAARRPQEPAVLSAPRPAQDLPDHQQAGQRQAFRDQGHRPPGHSDHSFTTRPTMASALYCKEIPSIGGDTLFSRDIYMAYDTLSDGLKKILDGLEAVHDIVDYAPFRTRSAEQVAEMRRINPAVAQPVVRVHPETGKKALYVSEALTFRFVGMTEDESRGLLRFLWSHSVKPEFVYRHPWKVGDLLMWDNRCAMHMAPADYAPGQPRLMHRITILGQPSGRFLHEQAPRPAAPGAARRRSRRAAWRIEFRSWNRNRFAHGRSVDLDPGRLDQRPPTSARSLSAKLRRRSGLPPAGSMPRSCSGADASPVARGSSPSRRSASRSRRAGCRPAHTARSRPSSRSR